MKKTLKVYHLRAKDDPTFAIQSHGKTVKAAIEDCSGGAAKWEHVTTEEIPYLHAGLMSAIAASLPGKWDAEPQSIEYANCNWHLIRDDGLNLFVSMPCYGHKNKLEISCSPPRENRSWVTVYGPDGKKLECPKIGVGDTKTPDQIAKDIARRLLADAETYHKLVVDRIALNAASDANQLEVYRQLCKVFGCQPREQRDPSRLETTNYFGAGSFEVNSSGTVTFKLNSVPAAQALKLAETLATIPKS